MVVGTINNPGSSWSRFLRPRKGLHTKDSHEWKILTNEKVEWSITMWNVVKCESLRIQQSRLLKAPWDPQQVVVQFWVLGWWRNFWWYRVTTQRWWWSGRWVVQWCGSTVLVVQGGPNAQIWFGVGGRAPRVSSKSGSARNQHYSSWIWLKWLVGFGL